MLGIRVDDPEELAAFVHLWRVIGHCLGLNPDFNLCTASLDETINRVSTVKSRLICPTFLTQTTVYTQITQAFTDIFWYLNPIVTLNSILFLNNRLVGVPGYYLTTAERDQQLKKIHHYKTFFKQYSFKKYQLETSAPRCRIFSTHLKMWDRILVRFVVFILESLILKSAFWRRFFNGFVVLVQFLVRKLAFLADRDRGFKNTYAYFLRLRHKAIKRSQLNS